jgi:nitrogen fixation NifU-like protein
MSLDLLYQDVILDHWRNPRHGGELAAAQATVHRVNPTCGDEVTVDVELGGEAGDVLTGFAHRGHGCSISRGAASVFAELAVDHTVAEIASIHDAFVEQLRSAGTAGDVEVLGDAIAFAGVGRFPARVRCALLPWTAAAEAIAQAQASRLAPTSETGQR